MHIYLSSVILFLSLFYVEVHKKSQVDFKLTVLKQETDMNSVNNPHRAALPVTLSLLQGWKNLLFTCLPDPISDSFA